MGVFSFIRKRPVLVFFVLTFLISWGSFFLAVGGPEGIPGSAEELERLLPIAIAALLLGPSVSGLFLTGVTAGRKGFRDLLSRLCVWRVGVRWYAVAFLAAPLVFLVVLFALSFVSSDFVPGVFAVADWPSLLLSGVLAGFVVGFFEELGWTGFVLPRLRLRFSVLVSALVVGVLWGAWHILTNDLWACGTTAGDLPLEYFIVINGFGFLVGQLPAFRVLMAWVYDRTQSLLLAVFMHASLLFSTFVFGPVGISGTNILVYDGALAVGMWLVVAAVAIAEGGSLTRKPGRV